MAYGILIVMGDVPGELFLRRIHNISVFGQAGPLIRTCFAEKISFIQIFFPRCKGVALLILPIIDVRK